MEQRTPTGTPTDRSCVKYGDGPETLTYCSLGTHGPSRGAAERERERVIHHHPMKKLIYHCLLGALLPIVSASAQPVAWLEHYGEPGNVRFDDGALLTSDQEGNVYAAAQFAGPHLDLGDTALVSEADDWMLLKYDADGNLLWTRAIHSACFIPSPIDMIQLLDIAFDENNDQVIVSGQYTSIQYYPNDTLYGECGNGQHGFIASFSADGVHQWARRVNGYEVWLQSIVIANDGIHIFGFTRVGGGTFYGTPNQAIALGSFHALYSSSGALLTAENISSAGVEVYDAAVVANEHFVLCGYTPTSGTLLGNPITTVPDATIGFVVSSDLAGTVDWMETFTSANIAAADGCAVGPSGIILVSGGFTGDAAFSLDTLFAPDVYNGFVIALHPDGTIQWIRQLASSGNGGLDAPQFDATGHVLLSGGYAGVMQLGTATLPSMAERSGFLASIDTNGVWQAAYGMGKIYRGSYLCPGPDGIYFSCNSDSSWVMGSYTVDYPVGTPDPYNTFLIIGKLDSLSGFTGISPMPLQEGDLHIYANPNAGTCTIDLPEQLRLTDDLMLSIFDQTGHLVQRMPMRYTNEGVALDIRAQAKGIYHVELGDGRQRYTGTIVFE